MLEGVQGWGDGGPASQAKVAGLCPERDGTTGRDVVLLSRRPTTGGVQGAEEAVRQGKRRRTTLPPVGTIQTRSAAPWERVSLQVVPRPLERCRSPHCPDCRA